MFNEYMHNPMSFRINLNKFRVLQFYNSSWSWSLWKPDCFTARRLKQLGPNKIAITLTIHGPGISLLRSTEQKSCQTSTFSSV